MKSLFNDSFETYTKDALQIAKETQDVIRPIFEKWVSEGYKHRELEYIMSDEIAMLGAEFRLTMGFKR
jgi:hypothetical protein